MKELFENEGQGAIFNGDKQYRWILWRIWNTNAPIVNFIGLNPSTANEDVDDPTIRRLIGFVKQEWGYGGFYMTNLFGLVTPYPNELLTHADPIGTETDKYIEESVLKSSNTVYCWGNFNEATERADHITVKYKEHLMYCFGKNKNGTPRHPLYLSSKTELEKY